MVDATFKDLCLDAVDADMLGRFWGAVLGRTVRTYDDEPYVSLRGDDDSATGLVWVNPVPEPRATKARVHLDLRMPVDDPSALVALGATVLREPGDEIGWWVMADPERNEFCAFGPDPRDDSPPAIPVPFELVVDSADPVAIARWWADRTGGRMGKGDDPWAWVEGAEGFPYRYWVFNPVPEPKTVKNRLHWDVSIASEKPVELIDAGAVVVREPDDEIHWWVMTDPEGNEFCAFPPSQQ